MPLQASATSSFMTGSSMTLPSCRTGTWKGGRMALARSEARSCSGKVILSKMSLPAMRKYTAVNNSNRTATEIQRCLGSLSDGFAETGSLPERVVSGSEEYVPDGASSVADNGTLYFTHHL